MWEIQGIGSVLAWEYRAPILVATFLYVPVIYGVQHIMKDRPALKLRTPFFIWNITLSFFSLLGCLLVMFDGNLHRYSHLLYHSNEFAWKTRMVWSMFCLTKSLEFGDTLFLVLRKKQLIFLHVYHHFTVALYTLYAQIVDISFGHLFGLINLWIHTFMYLYYAFASEIRHPFFKRCRPFITSAQTVQMFVGFTICAMTLGLPAETLRASEFTNAKFGLTMYASYAVLFSRFFYQNYIEPKRAAALKAQPEDLSKQVSKLTKTE